MSAKNKKSTADATAENGSNGSGSKDEKTGGIFRPLVVLALPGVNLFRRFSQYKRLPQDPPKDKLEVELERLNNKIVSFFSGLLLNLPISNLKRINNKIVS